MRGIIFNEKEIYRVFEDFYNVTGIRISIFEPPVRVSVYDSTLNFANCVAYPEAMPLGLCHQIRKSRTIDEKCICCDEAAVDKVMKTKAKYIYECHLGFYEALVPVVSENEVVALFFIGQVNMSPKSENDFSAFNSKLHMVDPVFYSQTDKSELRKNYEDMVVVGMKRCISICRLIEEFIPLAFEKKYISFSKNNIRSEFRFYIEKNLGRHVKLDEVCTELSISRAHLCRVLKKEFGVSFTEYVNVVKINKAKVMLATSSSPIREISSSLGIDDSNYFSRLFRRLTGMSATEYRLRFGNFISEP